MQERVRNYDVTTAVVPPKGEVKTPRPVTISLRDGVIIDRERRRITDVTPLEDANGVEITRSSEGSRDIRSISGADAAGIQISGSAITRPLAAQTPQQQRRDIPLRMENPALAALRAGQRDRITKAIEFRETVGDPVEILTTLLPVEEASIERLIRTDEDVEE